MNVAVIGCSSVGKSALVARLVQECPPARVDAPSEECWTAQFVSSRLPAPVEQDLCVCVISQRVLCGFFSHHCEAVMVVFDVTSQKSFEEAQRLVNSELSRRPVMLVGNKIDMQERVVPVESGRFFSSSRELPYVETSSLHGTNVQLAFAVLVKSARQRAQAAAAPKPEVGFTIIPVSSSPESTSSPPYSNNPTMWVRDEDVKLCSQCKSKVCLALILCLLISFSVLCRFAETSLQKVWTDLLSALFCSQRLSWTAVVRYMLFASLNTKRFIN
jgi:hypothetical protein